MQTDPFSFELRVRGHFPASLLEHLDGLELVQQPAGETLIRGELPDQAALFGLLSHLYHLGLELLAFSTQRD